MIITIVRQGFLVNDKLNILQYVLHVSLISTCNVSHIFL